ncbi:ABC transporter ATP-binding protein [Tateyamaria omphalii]|uniref:ABC transporter ATP-binding protein n=1 Tax=Tateyamaria omphalii TaxID=299262 RepID=UPI001C9918ED|nr:ABC transporter ATP-binding protein [Tateyamaria omphalii]MBY5935024.1 ABC transporter ATP-binding protein [Tateyamaria omphalii]
MSAPLLSVENLRIELATRGGMVPVVDDLSLWLNPGETLSIVGESGSGKSMTALAVMGLLPRIGRVAAGRIMFEGQDMIQMEDAALRRIRGNQIGMIFQEPMTSLNPVYTVGEQIAEVLRHHQKQGAAEAWANAVDLLDAVRIPNAKGRAATYPHEMSGGQRQRVMIAMALACRPKILIADEPTTALDVTVQAEIFDLMRELATETQTATILITHDMGVVAEMADRVVVMLKGEKVEDGTVTDLINRPQNDYTKSLIASVPHLTPETRDESEVTAQVDQPLLSVRDLTVQFAVKKRWGKREMFTAVNGISFDVERGKTLAIVGESGSGKTTAALAVARLVAAQAGHVTLDSTDMLTLEGEALRQARANVQVIFQDPYSSLNPRLRAGAIVREPMDNLGNLPAAQRDARVAELFEQVGLHPEQMNLFPHQFSGGQRQRISIARALSTNPSLIICDEAVSALDVIIQAQILDLLRDLQRDLNLTYLFISHDLGVVQQMCDHVAVMYMGDIVEYGTRNAVFAAPQKAYTRNLLAAVPSVESARESV